PEQPVSWRWRILWIFESKGVEVDIILPLWICGSWLSPGGAIADEGRADDTPGNDVTGEEGDGWVETDQHAGTDESWCPLEEPSPVLKSNGLVLVTTPDEDPGEDVPIPQDTERVLRNNSPDDTNEESVSKSTRLLDSNVTGGAADCVHRANS